MVINVYYSGWIKGVTDGWLAHTEEPSQTPMRPDNCYRNCQVRAAVSLISKDMKNASDPLGH